MSFSDFASGAAVLVSLAALVVAIRANKQSGVTRLREMRIQTRQNIENTKARISALPDHIRHLDISVIFAMSRSTLSSEQIEKHLVAGRRQCAEMFKYAALLVGKIEKLDTGLGDKSEAELEHLQQEALRIHREADMLHEKITSERAMYDGNQGPST